MLYGFSLLFGFAGTTNLYQLAGMLKAGDLSPRCAFGILALILVGIGFKVSIVPFHFWAPDVYEGVADSRSRIFIHGFEGRGVCSPRPFVLCDLSPICS